MSESPSGESRSGDSRPEESRPTRKTRGPRAKNEDTVAKKFLRNFDPDTSEREKRKLNRRLYPNTKKSQCYDENGLYNNTFVDLCDCLDIDCEGCHSPCLKCSSRKCGHECRVNRKWTYESIDYEGTDKVVINPLIKESKNDLK